MGKNRDITSISNSISKTILHEILVERGKMPEAKNKMKKEALEYREQSIEKTRKRYLNDEDKKVVNSKVIRKVNNDLKRKYPNLIVPKEVISKKVDEELSSFFE